MPKYLPFCHWTPEWLAAICNWAPDWLTAFSHVHYMVDSEPPKKITDQWYTTEIRGIQTLPFLVSSQTPVIQNSHFNQISFFNQKRYFLYQKLMKMKDWLYFMLLINIPRDKWKNIFWYLWYYYRPSRSLDCVRKTY